MDHNLQSESRSHHPGRYHIRSKRQHIPDNEGRGEHQNRYRYSRPSSHRATTCRRSGGRSITGQYQLATGTTQAAKAGDVISLYGNCFGTTNPPVAPGKVGATEAPAAKPVTVTIGAMPAPTTFARLSAAVVSVEYHRPCVAGIDHEVIAKISGQRTKTGVLLKVHP